MNTRRTVTGSFSPVYRGLRSRSSCGSSWNDNPKAFTSLVGRVSTKTVTSVDTPGFHKLRDCGEFLPINPFTVETVVETRKPDETGWQNHSLSPPCELAQYYGEYWSTQAWELAVPEPSLLIVQSVVNSAAAEAKAAVFDALTFLAEARELHSLTKTVITRVIRVAKIVARKSVRSKVAFGSLWLEYRYAWTPLVLSLIDGIDAYNAAVSKGDVLNGTSRQSESLSGSSHRIINASDRTTSVTEVLDGTRTYRGCAYSRVKSTTAARFGFDPLLTTWELVTFSFIMDWFIDVNSYLQAISPFSGAELLGVGYSIKDDYTLSQVWSQNAKPPLHSGGLQGVETTFEVKRYVRSPSAVSLPVWNPALNWKRLADLTSLIMGGLMTVSLILSKGKRR